jgi:hypothetical protein
MMRAMSRAAFSLKVFACYLFVLGVALVAAPNVLLGLFGLATGEVWIRVVGVLAFNIGAYYWAAAACEARAVFVASVATRVLVFAAFGAFVALGLARPVLVLFGAADLAGGLWTAAALRLAPARAPRPA